MSANVLTGVRSTWSTTHVTTTTPDLETLRRTMRQAQRVWEDAIAARQADPTDETKARLTVAARLTSKAEAEYMLAKRGQFRRTVPAGRIECPRCGGFGGADQWPGFVCFQCDGLGHVDES